MADLRGITVFPDEGAGDDIVSDATSLLLSQCRRRCCCCLEAPSRAVT